MTGHGRSARRLCERMAASGHPLRMYTGDALYHLQVDYTCQLLDVVDEVADEVMAGMITDLIYEKLAGDGASEAVQRIREARKQAERLMRDPRPIITMLNRDRP